MNTHYTHWEDDNGAEWDIKIEYTLSPYKPQVDNPDDPLFGPEEPTEVEVYDVYRKEPYAINGVETGTHWVLWDGETGEELESWKTEILEDTSSYCG